MNDIKTADSPYVLSASAVTKIVSFRLLRLLRLLRFPIPLRLPTLLILLKLGQMVTIPQRPPEEEAEVGNWNEEMEEEKRGSGTGLRSYI